MPPKTRKKVEEQEEEIQWEEPPPLWPIATNFLRTGFFLLLARRGMGKSVGMDFLMQNDPYEQTTIHIVMCGLEKVCIYWKERFPEAHVIFPPDLDFVETIINTQNAHIKKYGDRKQTFPDYLYVNLILDDLALYPELMSKPIWKRLAGGSRQLCLRITFLAQELKQVAKGVRKAFDGIAIAGGFPEDDLKEMAKFWVDFMDNRHFMAAAAAFIGPKLKGQFLVIDREAGELYQLSVPWPLPLKKFGNQSQWKHSVDLYANHEALKKHQENQKQSLTGTLTFKDAKGRISFRPPAIVAGSTPQSLLPQAVPKSTRMPAPLVDGFGPPSGVLSNSVLPNRVVHGVAPRGLADTCGNQNAMIHAGIHYGFHNNGNGFHNGITSGFHNGFNSGSNNGSNNGFNNGITTGYKTQNAYMGMPTFRPPMQPPMGNAGLDPQYSRVVSNPNMHGFHGYTGGGYNTNRYADPYYRPKLHPKKKKAVSPPRPPSKQLAQKPSELFRTQGRSIFFPPKEDPRYEKYVHMDVEDGYGSQSYDDFSDTDKDEEQPIYYRANGKPVYSRHDT